MPIFLQFLDSTTLLLHACHSIVPQIHSKQSEIHRVSKFLLSAVNPRFTPFWKKQVSIRVFLTKTLSAAKLYTNSLNVYKTDSKGTAFVKYSVRINIASHMLSSLDNIYTFVSSVMNFWLLCSTFAVLPWTNYIQISFELMHILNNSGYD